MAKMKKLFTYTFFLLTAAIFYVVVLYLCASAVKPDFSVKPKQYSQADIEKFKKARQTSLDKDNPPVIYREVDYSKGKKAKWFPKGESPILAELVKQGKLPDVQQRVGDEPLVLQGVDGIGNYGGTWYRLGKPDVLRSRLSYVSLVRWSPQGYPIVPHVAKSYEISPDNREFTFHLRKGMKWSDGHPFTADDILFWWEHVANDRSIKSEMPDIMRVKGQTGNVVKIDSHTVKFTFPVSNGIFLAKLASSVDSTVHYPAHYCRKYHPATGDPNVISDMVKRGKYQSPEFFFRDIFNSYMRFPDCPRLWPWVLRKYKSSAPYNFVRNPYFWAVDNNGNQLPYIDQILFEEKTEKMIPIAAAGGDVSLQSRYMPFREYTYLMSQRQAGDYDIYHWYPGDRSAFLIFCNQNYKIDETNPDTKKRADLLTNKKFRRALSLAIDRKAIIKAEYSNVTEPAQCAPGPDSPFYEPTFYHAAIEYDPQTANKLLDEIGLAKRDRYGYRTFPDGSRMSFFLNLCTAYVSPEIGQFVTDDWAKAGLRVIPKIMNRDLFYAKKLAGELDLSVWGGNNEFLPLIEARNQVPRTIESNFALSNAIWYMKGGMYGQPGGKTDGGSAPAPDSDLRKTMELYDQTCLFSDPAKQKTIFDQILKINADNLWTINISTPPPVLGIVKNGFKNVPKNAVFCWDFKSPGNMGMETYYFEKPYNHEKVIAEISDSMINVETPPEFAGANGIDSAEQNSRANIVLNIFKYGLFAAILFVIVASAIKQPLIARRLLIMIPTLLIISILIFIIIQAPPGDFVNSYIMKLQIYGGKVNQQAINELKEMFWLDRPLHVRYAKWMGLYWFKTFDSKDTGLLQGNLGRSMTEERELVNDLVGDRITITVLISLGSILFTWCLAIPIGIYSAVKQYSIGDSIFTLIGFIGMCIPAFLLALLLMYFAKTVFNISVTGLFSSEFGSVPGWSIPKFIDMLKHIWLPIVVLGTGGTAGMIRVMRGNLLDELKKPYVVTAKAKGVKPMKLLFKYPVRIALNPFISGIGGLFPQLISGGAIVAVVLSLPTIGPLMLDALMNEDMYLAGSMLMILSFLGVMGTLVSDILLLWLDPRIRFKAGTR